MATLGDPDHPFTSAELAGIRQLLTSASVRAAEVGPAQDAGDGPSDPPPPEGQHRPLAPETTVAGEWKGGLTGWSRRDVASRGKRRCILIMLYNKDVNLRIVF